MRACPGVFDNHGITLTFHSFIKLFAVQGCGESEFWLALRKMLLIIGLIIYTFITILGGNPLHDRFQEVRSDPPRNYFVKYFDKVFS
jgi:amino acid permease